MSRRHLVSTSAALLLLAISRYAMPATLSPSDDTYVRSGFCSSYDDSTSLLISTEAESCNKKCKDAYLKFDISGEDAALSRAILRIYASADSTTTLAAHTVSDTTWTESQLTWCNRPEIGDAVAAVTITSSTRTWYELDITSYVQAEKAAGRNLISMALHQATASTHSIQADSELGTNPPRLIVSYAPAAPFDVIAVAGDQSATISWSAIPDATSYTVKRSTTTGSGYTSIAAGITGTSYMDTGLIDGTPYFYVVTASNGRNTSADSNQARVTPAAAPSSAVYWPLSGASSPDADGIRFPYGPRKLGSDYDFHGGIDMPAASGTPVRAVMAGEVEQIVTCDPCSSSGPGQKVLLSHDAGLHWTAYLHLSQIADGLQLGQHVRAGQVIAYSGDTGAEHPHLHLTYMVGLLSPEVRESQSKNPLEVLPHTTPSVTASFQTDGSNTVVITMPAHRMTVRWVILMGQGQARIADYYDIVAQGSTKRDTQSQYGIYLDATAPPAEDPQGSRYDFDLIVRPDPVSDFVVERVILKDIYGTTILDATRP